MEGRRIRKMENLVKPETTPAIVGNGIDSCHILHCIKWGNILPFMTRSPICYGNIKIVTILLNRKKGVYKWWKVWYHLRRGKEIPKAHTEP